MRQRTHWSGPGQTATKRLRRGLALVERAEELVVANAKDVAILNGFSLHPVTIELNAVGGTHVDHIEVPARELDEGVLSGDVGITNCQIRRGLSPSNDEAILGYLKGKALIVHSESMLDGRGPWTLGHGRPRDHRV